MFFFSSARCASYQNRTRQISHTEKMPFCKWRKGKNSSRGGNFGKLLGNFEAITRRLPRAAHSCSVRALVDVLLFLLSYVLQARLNRCLTCIDKLSEDFSVAPLVPSETIINLISPKRPCQCFGKKERQKAKKKRRSEKMRSVRRQQKFHKIATL